MKNRVFEGWYFKHQKGHQMVSFIPGRAVGGAFLQVMTPLGSRQFDLPALEVQKGVIQAGKCRFSLGGCRIDLPGIRGELRYGPIQPLNGDIMGPFRHFPMECRHGILSMDHSLSGSLIIDGIPVCFDGGAGYIEQDSGISFPRSYQWLQCNTFPESCSIMASVAEIPVLGVHFRGCICAIVYGGQEYRFATYLGVRIHTANEHHICLSQGKFLLELDIAPRDGGHTLLAPAAGEMSQTIRECCNASLRARLWEGERLVFDLYSSTAACERVTDLWTS